jgi:WD40 repeat protein
LRIVAQRSALLPTGYREISVVVPATAVAFSPDGSWFATGDADKNVLFWQVSGDKVATTPTRTFSGHKTTVTDVSFSPDGNRIASASLDHIVRIWELR